LPDRLKIKTVIEVWKQLVNDEEKIISIDTERLFGSFESSFYKKVENIHAGNQFWRASRSKIESESSKLRATLPTCVAS